MSLQSAINSVTAEKLKRSTIGELQQYWHDCKKMEVDWLRFQILGNGRIDILANTILNLQTQPFHLALLRYQFTYNTTLQLVFRGSGKTTLCVMAKSIYYVLKDPNTRILIPSKTIGHSKAILSEVKAHLEDNSALIDVFGHQYHPRECTKWDETEIRVLPRTSKAKESTITAIGVGGQVVGKHYDEILGDDLVDEENSQTETQREKLKTWYYKTLDPTLEPPDTKHPHRGEMHLLGTRYHFQDLWGHLIDNELKDRHQIIKCLNDKGQSPWPSKYPPEWFLEKRRKSGLIIFNSQYMNDTEAMKGEIFQYDHCQKLSSDKWPAPSDLRIFMGVDLAISQKDEADMFAIVVIGITPDKSATFFLDYFEGHLRFSEQSKKIVEYAKRWDPIRIGIETVQYQESQAQVLEDFEGEEGGFPLRIKKIQTDEDKITRAWKRTPKFENKQVFFRTHHDLLIEHFVLFTGKPKTRRDLFDAYDLAELAAEKKGRRRRRRAEPGLM